jgi:hypothetical protein
MENFHRDSATPEEDKKNLLGALKEAEQPAADNNSPMTKFMTEGAGGPLATAAVVAMEVRNDLAAGPGGSSFTKMPAKKQNTPFVGGGSTGNNKASSVRVSIVPMSYGDKKKAAAKKAPGKAGRDAEIVTRSRVTKMSLTGYQIKGASVTDSTAKTLKAAKLREAISFANQTILKPFERGSRRLEVAMKHGTDNAETFVQRNPDALKNTTPQFQQSMSPK